MDREEAFRQFAETGEDRVRLHISTGGYPHLIHGLAIEWLAEQDHLSRSRNEASQREQYRTALTAKNAAIVAAVAAIISIPLATIGIIIT